MHDLDLLDGNSLRRQTLTVFLHVNNDQSSRVRSKGTVMGPIVGRGSQLTLAHLVMRRLSRFIHDGSMVMSRIQDGQAPDSRGTSCDEHERAVHQSGSSAAFSGLLRKSIPRPVVTTTIAAQPHLCRSTRLLFCRSTRGLDHHVVAVGFAMTLDGSEERGPKKKLISLEIIKDKLIL
jgi:hypothetical protein